MSASIGNRWEKSGASGSDGAADSRVSHICKRFPSRDRRTTVRELPSGNTLRLQKTFTTTLYHSGSLSGYLPTNRGSLTPSNSSISRR